MILLAVLFGLLSMVGYAFSGITSQPLAKKLGNAQVIFLRGLTVIVVLAAASISSIHHLQDVHYVVYALVLGVLGYLPLLAFTHGIKISRIGIVSPIGGCSPLITVLLAYFLLSTALSGLQWLAIALIVAANIGVSVNVKSLKDSNIVNLASGVPFGLAAAIGWGVFYYALIYPTRALGPWLSALLVEIGVTVGAGIHILAAKQRPVFRQSASKGVIASGLSVVLGTVGFTVGVDKYNVGIVAALSNSMALLSFLLAAYFFKEKLNRTEAVAAVVMVIGVVLISIK